MTLIDTHSHIYLSEFADDQTAMLDRAGSEGVGAILMPAVDSTTHAALFELEAAQPDRCFAMMGVHPCSVKENYKEELRIARDWLDKRPFKAVGEIGLDFYWDKTFTDQQYAAFREQLEWAMHFDIPVSIHSRNATNECIAVVKELQQGKIKGVFHCFSGDVKQAQEIIGLGMYLGIGGVVTFKNSGLDKVIEAVAIDHVVLETDAPYLAPMPFRGKRNEPAYLKYMVEKLAEIMNISTDEVGRVATKNAKDIFSME